MTEIVLFHHALGRTPGVVALADRLREAGHTVHTPDLFESATFTTVEEGLAHAGRIGFGEVIGRGARAVADLPPGLVYAGISLGVLCAQNLAQNRPGALGAVLLESFVPPSEFGAWPAAVPVQIHGMDGDPSFAGEGDLDAARIFVDAAPAHRAELFTYPGDAHLFTDSGLPAHDAATTALVMDRVLAFLDEL